MIGSAAPARYPLALPFRPAGTKMHRTTGIRTPLSCSVKVKLFGTEKGKSNQSTEADQNSSVLKMLLKINPLKIGKPMFSTQKKPIIMDGL